MSILKASFKLFARTINDIALTSRKKKVNNQAYKTTGEQINKAKRKGQYINGAKAYKSNYNKELNKAKQTHNNIDKFISDL